MIRCSLLAKAAALVSTLALAAPVVASTSGGLSPSGPDSTSAGTAVSGLGGRSGEPAGIPDADLTPRTLAEQSGKPTGGRGGPANIEVAPAGLHGFPFTLGCCYYEFSDIGYTIEEYFVSGTAKSYTDEPMTAPYAARVLVVRPEDPSDFNGTVFAEWENVTGRFPAGPGMVWLHHHILPKGYAYVAVNAQKVGHDFLQTWDPIRYEGLGVHPGDEFSYDIFSQAVGTIRHPSARRAGQPMEGLTVESVVGYGQSQSAGRLNSYMNLAQNDARALDAVIIQADGGHRKSFPDLRVPLIHFETEDAIVPTPPDPANDPRYYRLWEVVGTAHLGSENQSPGVVTVPTAATTGEPRLPWAIDAAYWEHNHYGEEGPSPSSGLAVPDGVAGSDLPEQVDDIPAPGVPEEVPDRVGGCGGNEMPFRYALEAALEGLHFHLAGNGPMPPQPPRATFVDGVLQRDEFGNALGGLRLPPIDVPVATYSAAGCPLFGSTTPLRPDQLLDLYPTNADYVSAMAEHIDRAVADRIMTPEGGAQLLRKANRSLIPYWRPSTQYGIEYGAFHG